MNTIKTLALASIIIGMALCASTKKISNVMNAWTTTKKG